MPPNGEERGEEYFDVGAKYHVANLRFIYTRYQLARVLQFEFLRQFCKEDVARGVHFDLCDVERDKQATKRFREMLTFGASKPWREQIKFVSNGEKDYFELVYNTHFAHLSILIIKVVAAKIRFVHSWINIPSNCEQLSYIEMKA